MSFMARWVINSLGNMLLYARKKDFQSFAHYYGPAMNICLTLWHLGQLKISCSQRLPMDHDFVVDYGLWPFLKRIWHSTTQLREYDAMINYPSKANEDETELQLATATLLLSPSFTSYHTVCNNTNKYCNTKWNCFSMYFIPEFVYYTSY